ncbi:MAG: hypothetical protein U0835_07415 [Isosphaeraceae bacterium]
MPREVVLIGLGTGVAFLVLLIWWGKQYERNLATYRKQIESTDAAHARARDLLERQEERFRDDSERHDVQFTRSLEYLERQIASFDRQTEVIDGLHARSLALLERQAALLDRAERFFAEVERRRVTSVEPGPNTP